jgi:hypothetical protein
MITSYAARFMHKFINLPGNNCFYMDTDGIVLQHPLDPKYVGKGLGQFKYLGKIKRGYFISPKLYCLIYENGETIIKSKGINSKLLTENDFKEMLHGLTIGKNNVYRFKKDLSELIIKYKKSELSLFQNFLKREPIYENNIIVATKPLIVNNNILIKHNQLKFSFSIVKYDSFKYSLVKYISFNYSIIKYESRKYSIVKYEIRKYSIVKYEN